MADERDTQIENDQMVLHESRTNKIAEQVKQRKDKARSQLNIDAQQVVSDKKRYMKSATTHSRRHHGILGPVKSTLMVPPAIAEEEIDEQKPLKSSKP